MFNKGDIIRINNNERRGCLSIGDEFVVVDTTENTQWIKQLNGCINDVGKIWSDSTSHLEHYDKID